MEIEINREGESNHGRKINLPLLPEQLLKLARSFSCFFWGIPLCLALASGMLDFQLIARLRIPTYLVGIISIFWGLMLANRIDPPTGLWKRRVQQAMFAVLINISLAPFTIWWKARPHVPFFAFNVLGVFICTVWLLVMINQLAGETAKALYDRVFYIESQLCAWFIVFSAVLPSLIYLFGSAYGTIRYETGFYIEILAMYRRTRYWLYAFSLFPFTLTMAIAWKAKERSLEALKMSAKVGGME